LPEIDYRLVKKGGAGLRRPFLSGNEHVISCCQADSSSSAASSSMIQGCVYISRRNSALLLWLSAHVLTGDHSSLEDPHGRLGICLDTALFQTERPYFLAFSQVLARDSNIREKQKACVGQPQLRARYAHLITAF
jgi:hypothetical protein